MDFSALPPEINSALMWAGAGAAPLIQAGQAWATLSTELSAAAQAYGSVITNLLTVWQGPSATAMTTAAQSYLSWLEDSATQAALTADQATVAASAYSAAFAATVSPVEVAANRAQLLMLVTTNLLGQNTPAIAATEAAYEAMWAQDAAAMNNYAASSQTAAQGLPQFSAPPQTTSGSPAAPAAAPAAVAPPWFDNLFGNGTTLGQNWQALVSSGFPFDAAALFSNFIGYTMIAGATSASVRSTVTVPQAPITVTPYVPAMEAPKAAAAASGAAGQIGRLSVPPSWAQPQPQKEADRWPPRPVNANVTGPKAAIPAVPFMPVTSMRSAQGKIREEPEYGVVPKVVPPRHPAGG